VVILEVLAGVRSPSEAAKVLEITAPRYYQLETRTLVGMLRARLLQLGTPITDCEDRLETGASDPQSD
jgi:hypothetical protein